MLAPLPAVDAPPAPLFAEFVPPALVPALDAPLLALPEPALVPPEFAAGDVPASLLDDEPHAVNAKSANAQTTRIRP
ncbi:MAG TPA: hypothetical protein VHV51_08715 [Polyangiaceae bacterium]|jgi:hypothetical protein|nr:hypothetical protein [Polyangiaceae bacterium]